jgi:cystathionine beta-lyase/cystathionine gamma-synthase
MLEAHPAVAWVCYPFLESHPGHAIARRQMANGSGMLVFGLHAGYEGARRMMETTRDGVARLITCESSGEVHHLASTGVQ